MTNKADYKGHANLAEMIKGHIGPLASALFSRMNYCTMTLDHDNAAYWQHELDALQDIARAVHAELGEPFSVEAHARYIKVNGICPATVAVARAKADFIPGVQPAMMSDELRAQLELKDIVQRRLYCNKHGVWFIESRVLFKEGKVSAWGLDTPDPVSYDQARAEAERQGIKLEPDYHELEIEVDSNSTHN